MLSAMRSQDLVTVPPSSLKGAKLVYKRSYLGEFKWLLNFHAYPKILSFTNFNLFCYKILRYQVEFTFVIL